MRDGLMILLGIHGISLLFLCAIFLKYDHVRRKYAAFLSALDDEGAQPLMRRTFLVYMYLIVILFTTVGTILLFLWKPHLL